MKRRRTVIALLAGCAACLLFPACSGPAEEAAEAAEAAPLPTGWTRLDPPADLALDRPLRMFPMPQRHWYRDRGGVGGRQF